MTGQQKAADLAAKYLNEMSTELISQEDVSKIDWMKLLELIMKILPLILSFFKPANGRPEE